MATPPGGGEFVTPPPQVRAKEVTKNGTTAREIREEQLEAYEEWIESIPPENRTRTIARALLLRDRQLERYTGRAYTDKLTGLPNRRSFDEDYQKAVNKFNETNGAETFGLLIADIDHFKKLNDTYGHKIADIVLIGTGLRMQNNIKAVRETNVETKEDGNAGEHEEPLDTAYRWGGEEIVFILRNLNNEQDLMKIGERLRMAMSEKPFSVKTEGKVTDVEATASFGGAIYRGEKPEEFFRTIDKTALYGAKQNGRNRTYII